MKSASSLWLLRHELRLVWRSIAVKRWWLLLLIGGLLWALLHYAAWALLKTGPVFSHPLLSGFRLQIAGAVFWLLTTVLLAQTVAQAVMALFDRGDLDLLLASPLDPRRILLVRGLGIAVSALVLPLFLLLPFAHMSAIQGHFGLLSLYPLILAMGLLCAGIGIGLTLGLVRWFGARRARVIAQVLGALFGAGIFLLSQFGTLLSPAQRTELLGWFAREVGYGGWLAHNSLLWWPERAASGEWLPLLVCCTLAVLVFGLALTLTWRRFLSGAQESLTGTNTRRRPATARKRFRSGIWTLLLSKEWKLLVRDPQVISQTLLQMLYLCPMLLLAVRKPDQPEFLMPGLVLISGMLAGNLAWLAVAAEDAPDLLGSAPHPGWKLRLLKSLAAVLPALILLLPVVLYWLYTRPLHGVILLLCAVGATLGAGLTQTWNPASGKRHDLRTRYKQNRISSMLEVFSVMGWAATGLLLLGGYLRWLPLSLSLALLAPTLAWVLGRSRRREAGY